LFALNDSFGSYDVACSDPWITSGSFRGYPRHNLNPMRSSLALTIILPKLIGTVVEALMREIPSLITSGLSEYIILLPSTTPYTAKVKQDKVSLFTL